MKMTKETRNEAISFMTPAMQEALQLDATDATRSSMNETQIDLAKQGKAILQALSVAFGLLPESTELSGRATSSKNGTIGGTIKQKAGPSIKMLQVNPVLVWFTAKREERLQLGIATKAMSAFKDGANSLEDYIADKAEDSSYRK